MAADMKSTLSKELVFGRALRPSNDPDFFKADAMGAGESKLAHPAARFFLL
jgi:hypothetical protein